MENRGRRLTPPKVWLKNKDEKMKKIALLFVVLMFSFFVVIGKAYGQVVTGVVFPQWGVGFDDPFAAMDEAPIIVLDTTISDTSGSIGETPEPSIADDLKPAEGLTHEEVQEIIKINDARKALKSGDVKEALGYYQEAKKYRDIVSQNSFLSSFEQSLWNAKYAQIMGDLNAYVAEHEKNSSLKDSGFEKAISNYISALNDFLIAEVYKPPGFNPYDIAGTYLKYANVLATQRRDSDATKNYEKAEEVLRKIGSSHGLGLNKARKAIVKIRKSELFYRMSSLELAEKEINTAISLHGYSCEHDGAGVSYPSEAGYVRVVKSHLLRANILADLKNSKTALESYDCAEAYLNSVPDLYKDRKEDPALFLEIAYGKAKIYHNNNDIELAKGFYEETVKLYASNGRQGMVMSKIMDAYLSLSWIYRGAGDDRKYEALLPEIECLYHDSINNEVKLSGSIGERLTFVLGEFYWLSGCYDKAELYLVLFEKYAADITASEFRRIKASFMLAESRLEMKKIAKTEYLSVLEYVEAQLEERSGYIPEEYIELVLTVIKERLGVVRGTEEDKSGQAEYLERWGLVVGNVKSDVPFCKLKPKAIGSKYQSVLGEFYYRNGSLSEALGAYRRARGLARELAELEDGLCAGKYLAEANYGVAKVQFKRAGWIHPKRRTDSLASAVLAIESSEIPFSNVSTLSGGNRGVAESYRIRIQSAELLKKLQVEEDYSNIVEDSRSVLDGLLRKCSNAGMVKECK